MKRFLALSLLAFAACANSSETKIDQAKFRDLYRAGVAMQGFDFLEMVRGSSIDFSRSLRQLKGDCEAARASNRAESMLLQKYQNAAHDFEMSFLQYQNWTIGKPENAVLRLAGANFETGMMLIKEAGGYYNDGVISLADIARAQKETSDAVDAMIAADLKRDPELKKIVEKLPLTTQGKRSEARTSDHRREAAIDAEIERMRKQRKAEAVAREAAEVSPDTIVMCDIGGPYYHFQASCENWKSSGAPFSLAHLWRMPLSEAKKTLQRCPECQSPLYEDPDVTVYYLSKNPYYHRADCKTLPEYGKIGVLLDWAAKNLKPCPICKPPTIGK